MKKLTDPQYCRILLKKRNVNSGVGFYFGRVWKWKLFATVIAIISVFGMWIYLDEPGKIGAAVVAGFFLGVQIRDLQWWRGLTKDWPRVDWLIDWAKVERIAGENESTGSDPQPNPVETSNE